ncbi:uncharacterized protein LOC122047735 [Zingiber officinale]|uniref:Late embryogenesis abundant protein LEA-2 subgroup domain-containing protein n=1 Tax=Zingiber officinale TaxID=94328 RepID=A0A8J5I1Q4_ZINOF|nr:uncharacterized protein LOC122043211 [Zingiber officinale]XP_042465123.1 uncharacterized protein LOC122047735 [Zingiber officinale]KAG6526548.1 hypothetical protein ZIOFF_016538 [Zingiber officinale]KAG6530332.1 hypothetical protein ZIOFF_012559 [Zingiber officinale]
MLHAKSESDVTSLAPSSPPRSPKRQAYYVQSPSRDSHDGDKSSTMQATPVFNSPMESPSHPSFGRHSRTSSASRFSGPLRSSSGRKGYRKRVNDKGWPECNVIQEEGSYDDLDDDKGLSRRCQIILGFVSFVLLFTLFSLIIWGAARPYKPDVIVKSLSMDDFYAGEGTDATGVPTKMVTLNCSVKMSVYNTAAMFGIHVTSGPIRLMFSEIAVATGELQKYYQRRKSRRTVSVVLRGEKVPLYGAGASMTLSSTGGAVPLTLDFDIISRGYVIGKLVRVKHQKHISCPLVVDSSKTKPIKFSQKACTYF